MPAAELSSAIVESSEDAILATTLDGIILSWNRAAAALYGYPYSDAIGADVALLVPVDRRDELDEIPTAIRASEHVAHRETVHVDGDGPHRRVGHHLSDL